jgi:hypothetical protein
MLRGFDRDNTAPVSDWDHGARNAHSTTSAEVAHALWQMAEEYRAKAGALGTAPNIGEPPGRIRRR